MKVKPRTSRWKVTFVAIGLLTSALAVAASPSGVSAHGPHQGTSNPHGHAPWAPPFADDSSHSYYSSETTQADKDYWHQYFSGWGGEDVYDPTALSMWHRKTDASWVDIYWYVNTSAIAVGDYTCVKWKNNSECDRSRIRIHPDAYNLSRTLEANLVCHEVGHSVGLRDGGWARTSCMDSGDNAQLGVYERSLINARY